MSRSSMRIPASRFHWHRLRLTQSGAALVISALVITGILAFSVLVLGRASQAELRGVYQGSDALQALLSAESGLQRAAKRITNLGSACGVAALTETVTDYPPGVNIAITSKTTDFDGVTALSATQCRLEATATVTASGVTRKISQIIDTSLFNIPAANLDFNTGNPPDGWTFSGTSPEYFRTAGGSDGTYPGCTQSAYLLKTSGARTTIAEHPIHFNAYEFSTAGNTTFSFAYDRRYLRKGAPDSDPANNSLFELTDSAPVIRSSATLGNGTPTSVGAIQSPNPPLDPCNSAYVSATRTLAIPRDQVVNPITSIGFTLAVRSNGGDKEVFLDNIVVTPPTLPSGGSYLRILKWRECLPSPNNCA